MACRSFWEFLLKFLNFLLTLASLAMVGYGIYLFVLYKQPDDPVQPVYPPVSGDEAFIQLGRPFLTSVSLSANILDKLPKAWFLFLFIGVGALLFVISCCGCIGASARNGCCLTTYAVFIVLLILVESGCAALMFFNDDWDDKIPKDETGNFEIIYDFIDDHWGHVKWVLLGIVVFEAVLFFLAVIVRAVNKPADYDSDEEYISQRQPFINRQPQATAPPVVVSDPKTPRNDTWSSRMREKYGLNTSEFTYNPSDPSRYQQQAAQPTEERGRCTIM